MLITISGIDSAGKSTQIERLREHLEARGQRPVVLWYRPGYSAEMDALRAFVRRLRPGALPTTKAAPEARRQVFERPSVRRTWVAMAVADMLLQYALKVRAQLVAGRTVICDRYITDALMDLELRFPELRKVAQPAVEVVRRVAPKPERALLLMLPHETMLERMALKNEPFPDAPDIRDRRYDIYGARAAGGGFEVVDADGTIDEVHARVLAALPEALR